MNIPLEKTLQKKALKKKNKIFMMSFVVVWFCSVLRASCSVQVHQQQISLQMDQTHLT